MPGQPRAAGGASLGLAGATSKLSIIPLGAVVGLIADYTGVLTGKNDVGVLVTVGGSRGACDVPSGAVNHHPRPVVVRGGHADCGSGFSGYA